MTLLAARALVARVPGIAWVMLFTAALAAGGLWFAFARGVRAGSVQAHRAALADSARVVHANVDTAAKVTDARVVMATQWRAKAEGAATRYQAQRATAGDGLETLPAPMLAGLVRMADTAVAQLRIAVQVDSAALAGFAAERAARIAADSVEAHQIALEPAPRGPDLIKVGALTAATVALLALVFR